MIVVHAILRATPERRADVVRALIAFQQATRANDTGCVHFAYTVDLEDDCLFTCVEEWQDVESLGAHLVSPHMGVLDEALMGATAQPAEIRIFQATPARLPASPDAAPETSGPA